MEEWEVGGPWTLTKGNSMDPKGEMYHQSDGEKAAVEEEESVGRLKNEEMEIEMEVDAELPQAESAEMKCPKRKVRRGESEKTQDYVCETLSISPEEAEECLCRVLSASREDPFTYATIAAAKKRPDTGNSRLNSWQWTAVVEKKAHRGRIWRTMGNEQFTRGISLVAVGGLLYQQCTCGTVYLKYFRMPMRRKTSCAQVASVIPFSFS